MATTTTQKNQKEGLAPVAPKNDQLAYSERFTEAVLKEFRGNVAGELQITDYQKQLIQGYFIGIDRALKIAEERRVSKNDRNSDHKYDVTVPCTWPNVDLIDLALDVVHFGRIGLDMMQPNHISAVPYFGKKTNTYAVTLMPGYNGIRYKAKKYALSVPTGEVVELVYETDTFKPIKKSRGVEVETYEFDITKPFNRGAIVGGFGYLEFPNPKDNKLIIMTLDDIEKRKPSNAAAEFWGGDKEVWDYVDGKKQKVTKHIEGWFAEMCYKTVVREVYGERNLPVDPKKIDDNYQYMKLREARYAELEAQAEIDRNANTIIIDTTPEDINPDPMQLAGHTLDPSTGEAIEAGSQDSADPAKQSGTGPKF